MRKPLILMTALAAVVNLSGCMVLSGEGPFHGDRGDLVNSDETVRYVGWCELHPRNAYCAPAPAVIADQPASHPISAD